MMKTIYDDYQSNEKIEIRKKDFFTDDNGFPNRNAFLDFCERIDEADEELYLITMNIDLRKANAQSRLHGDMVLRAFLMSLQSYPFFTMYGEKVNIFCKKENIDRLKAILEKPNDEYQIYYAISTEPYSFFNHDEIIRHCVDEMYADKAKKTKKIKLEKSESEITKNTIEGDSNHEETDLRKYIDTMWFSTITARITKPNYEKITLFVFPTKKMPDRRSLPLIVVLDDNVNNYRAVYQESGMVKIIHKGIPFLMTARIVDGSLDIMVFKDLKSDNYEVEFSIDTHDGVCFPDSFGKKYGENKQLFPLKRTSSGYWACVEFNEETGGIMINNKGIIENDDGTKYGVTKDAEAIELIPIKNE